MEYIKSYLGGYQRRHLGAYLGYVVPKGYLGDHIGPT
jgi:hypothetical protein